MSDLVRQKLFDELIELNEWFAAVRTSLDLSPKADRGRVMACVSKLATDMAEMKRKQALVARHYRYGSWGYLVRAARDSGEEAALDIELPKEILEVPVGWCYGEGKPDYSKARKQLPATQRLARKALAHIEELREVEGTEWAESTKQQLIETFVESTSWNELEEELWKFTNGIEDEPNHSLRSLLKRCRSSPDLVLAARRLGYRITRIKRLQSNESQLDVWRPKWMPTIEMKQTGSEVR